MRYVAIGDSFSEGMCDIPTEGLGPQPPHFGGEFRGWADRLAQALANQEAPKPVEYANLAIRGRLLQQIVDEQLQPALDMKPDLISFVGGFNDLLRPGVDLPRMLRVIEEAVDAIQDGGAQVLLSTTYNPAVGGYATLFRGNFGDFSNRIWALARRKNCAVIDLWSQAEEHDPRAWDEDRMHLSWFGHQKVANAALLALGRPIAGEVPLLPPMIHPPATERLSEHARWTQKHLFPWISRRIKGVSSGDGIQPKLPTPILVEPQEA